MMTYHPVYVMGDSGLIVAGDVAGEAQLTSTQAAAPGP